MSRRGGTWVQLLWKCLRCSTRARTAGANATDRDLSFLKCNLEASNAVMNSVAAEHILYTFYFILVAAELVWTK